MKDFTSQQREIVARKLGYNGPMQGFDEFIASSPSLEAKYAAITGKFVERMARGGLVKMKPKRYVDGGVVTDQQVADWYSKPENKALSDTQIKATMDQLKLQQTKPLLTKLLLIKLRLLMLLLLVLLGILMLLTLQQPPLLLVLLGL